jgi:hypothetical protein
MAAKSAAGTTGLLHRGAYTVLDNKFEARLSVMGFTHAQARCAVSFFRKYARDTKNGQYPKAIPFSPECVMDEGISLSTFRRSMKHGEGKTWRKVSQGGGDAKNHYAAVLEWLDTPPPKRKREAEHPNQIEPGSLSSLNPVYPIQNEQGQDRLNALEVMQKGNALARSLSSDTQRSEMKTPQHAAPSVTEPVAPPECGGARATETWNQFQQKRRAEAVAAKPVAELPAPKEDFLAFLKHFGT